MRRVFLIAALLLAVTCRKEALRGASVPSTDGKTYLVLADDNGGACGALMVDGKRWPHPLHVPGPIAPGRHEIQCGDSGAIAFEIEEGTTFHFDYSGP